jgi:hypothetical protein
MELQIKMTLQDIAESIGALDRIVADRSYVKSALTSIKNLRRAITGKHSMLNTGSINARTNNYKKRPRRSSGGSKEGAEHTAG